MKFSQKFYIGFTHLSRYTNVGVHKHVSDKVYIRAGQVEVAAGYAGSCHVLEMGRHYAEYVRYKEQFPSFPRVPGFPHSPYLNQLDIKSRASNVTGNIGEIIAGVVARRTLKIDAAGIALLKTSPNSQTRTLSRQNVTKGQVENNKRQVISVARAEVERIDHYVSKKEKEAAQAQPSQNYIPVDVDCREGNELKAALAAIPPGRAYASEYQHKVLAIFNYLFAPELIDGETEIETLEGTERRDIIFTNDSDMNFLEYIRREHSAILLMFETKNMEQIEAPALNQTATYLGERLGRLGFIVTRNAPSVNNLKKAFSIYNDSYPKKIILILSDNDLNNMLDMKCRGIEPVTHLQKAYRKFRTSVQ